MGEGYSGAAVVGDRLFIMGTRDQNEIVLAVNVSSGKEVWASLIGPIFTFKGNEWGDGPRATPTVDGDKVYALGGQGDLVCVEANSGKEIWRVSLPKDLGGEMSPAGPAPTKMAWGFTESPLVDGERLVCTPGGPQGTLAALNKATGKVVWRSTELNDPATYSSTVPAEIAGIRQYVQLTDRGAVGVAAQDGRSLWRYNCAALFGCRHSHSDRSRQFDLHIGRVWRRLRPGSSDIPKRQIQGHQGVCQQGHGESTRRLRFGGRLRVRLLRRQRVGLPEPGKWNDGLVG